MLTTLFALFVLFDLRIVVICDVPPKVGNITTEHNTITAGEEVIQEPAKFVDKLKKDLRKDNDDYIDTHNKNIASKTPAASSTQTTVSGDDRDGDAYVDQVNDVYRRMMHDRHTRHRHVQRRTDVGPDKFKLTEDKLKDQKHKHRSGIKHNMLGVYDRKRHVPYVSAGQRLYQFRAAAQAALAAEQARPAAGEHLAGDEQARLDMAPAKGGKINTLRDKRRRLCHRHVLIPEGPKYDSKGAVYLREHPPLAARPYPRTAPPRLLLPRCCNCCKKSVLGCE